MCVFKMSTAILLTVLVLIPAIKPQCLHGGVIKNLSDPNSSCYCQGSGHYGRICNRACLPDDQAGLLVPERCLDGSCAGHWGGIPPSCLDIRVPLRITRPPNKFPKCQIMTAPKTCIDGDENIFINRKLAQTLVFGCFNGGVMRTLHPNASCLCEGTHHHGKLCENSCSEYTSIPERCLSEDCEIPKSCVDVSRPGGLTIDRCKNGGILIFGKTGNTCSCYGTGFHSEFCDRKCPESVPPECVNTPCPEKFPPECMI